MKRQEGKLIVATNITVVEFMLRSILVLEYTVVP